MSACFTNQKLSYNCIYTVYQLAYSVCFQFLNLLNYYMMTPVLKCNPKIKSSEDQFGFQLKITLLLHH